MIYLTRRERFNAAHQLVNPNWSEEENFKVYGKCSNPNWHGHNYELFVTIKGEINEKLGYVADLKSLSNIINEKVISKLDHKNINLEVSFMKGKVATTENLAISIWEVLQPYVNELGAELHKIRITETENNSVEYYGEK
ncbi:MAG: 6-carboxytetrahydropterin synthase [Bacteroidales bacterium]|nr:6-carboxytetrahydropterin synthase [Bacteroidales bacterium]